MDLGITAVQRYETSHVIENVRLAEEVGFDFVGMGDSQSVFRELYTTMGVAARETERILIGPTVTQPVTRHPVVTASGVCTVDEISDGRAFLGIATGDSSVYTLGERPARLAKIEETIQLFQALSRGEKYSYDGTNVELAWVREADTSHEIPVFLAAEGPKTLQLAGAVAEGVLIGTGLQPGVLRRSIDFVDEGAREAGRDPSEVTKWVFAKINIADSREAAIDEIRMALAASANHAFRFTFENKDVPDEYRQPISVIREEYDPNEHEAVGESANRALLERLERDHPGLTEYLADRFAAVGPPASCIDTLRDIESVKGIDGVLLANLVEDDRELIAKVGEEVLPTFES